MLSRVQLFVTPMDYSTPGFPVFHYLPEFAQTHVSWVTDAIQPCYPLSPPSPLALNICQYQGLFQWVSSLNRWPKYWSFSISPSNEYWGLISFRIYWLDLLAVQGTLKSLLQHHSLKHQFFGPSAFFMVIYWTEGLMFLNCGVVLEKTHESPLDCKEIQPVNPKGNKPWIFIGRTNAEAPILWPPDAKN